MACQDILKQKTQEKNIEQSNLLLENILIGFMVL